jgi:hypothetical protein
VRNFGLAIGSFAVKRTTITLGRRVHMLVGLERGSNYTIDPFLSDTVRSLRWYSQRYGAYPWSTYTVAVMRDFSALSAFAYPTIGFFGESSELLVPHETAHQWRARPGGHRRLRAALLRRPERLPDDRAARSAGRAHAFLPRRGAEALGARRPLLTSGCCCVASATNSAIAAVNSRRLCSQV